MDRVVVDSKCSLSSIQFDWNQRPQFHNHKIVLITTEPKKVFISISKSLFCINQKNKGEKEREEEMEKDMRKRSPWGKNSNLWYQFVL